MTRRTARITPTRRPGPRLLLPLVTASALILTGCAQDTSPEETDTEATQSTESTTAAGTETGESSSASGSPEEGEGSEGSESSASGDAEGEGGEGSESAQATPDFPASNTTGLNPLVTIDEGDITPKSVVSNNHGLMITNNMMYSHNVTLFDVETRKPVVELSDTIDADEYELEGLTGQVSGAPVEAVWTKDGKYAYVSQYNVTDHGATAEDNCSNGQAITPSMVYRYNAEQEDWDQVIRVGRVPKYVELTPDESQLLVSNWCDKSLSVVDTATAEETKRIPLNSMPRGIAVLPDNKTAYVTAMYADQVYRVDLESGESEVALSTGDRPRHLSLSPDGSLMYLVVTGSDQLLKLDAETAEVIDSTTTGDEPRTMDISADGTALYVVNYFENSVSKFDAETLEELDRQPAGYHPIGVTHDASSGEVWVANYGGTLSVYDDTDQAEQG